MITKASAKHHHNLVGNSSRGLQGQYLSDVLQWLRMQQQGAQFWVLFLSMQKPKDFAFSGLCHCKDSFVIAMEAILYVHWHPPFTSTLCFFASSLTILQSFLSTQKDMVDSISTSFSFWCKKIHLHILFICTILENSAMFSPIQRHDEYNLLRVFLEIIGENYTSKMQLVCIKI